ncbi:MAG: hypothetical protein QME79_12410 [Bacillota bacterium]|nr:hypothetical protein [Bacillota bacterium]
MTTTTRFFMPVSTGRLRQRWRVAAKPVRIPVRWPAPGTVRVLGVPFTWPALVGGVAGAALVMIVVYLAWVGLYLAWPGPVGR